MVRRIAARGWVGPGDTPAARDVEAAAKVCEGVAERRAQAAQHKVHRER